MDDQNKRMFGRAYEEWLRKQEHEDTEDNSSWDLLSKWESLVDERIRAWIGDGNMSDHPLAGQRLNLDQEDNVQEEQRLAHKLMKDNEVVPPWMSLAFTLRDKHERIIKRANRYAQDFVRRRRDAIKAGSYVMDKHARDRWQEAIKTLQHDIGQYNSELLNYNLMVPPTIGQMIPLDAATVIDDALQQAERKAASDMG